ncbi:MAG: alpha-L-fucosidase [Armatimonadota bacterium]
MNNSITAIEKDRERRLEWFKAARFGMFVHWGLYSLIGRHEWAMNLEGIPIEEYEPYADAWKPSPGAARQWAKLAKQAGMRHIVLTAKHHEGFCLFDTKLTDYNSVKRGPGRDLVAEFVEAARAEGLKVGLYYSLMDWHHPDGARCWNDEAARKRFVEYTHGLVRELCTNYGKIDILWYDVPWPLSAKGWESEKLNAMVLELQPDIILNDRAGIPGDFGTPEQSITPPGPGRAWEAVMTFNSSWGYSPSDTEFKDARCVLRMLRLVASFRGNLMLNIGPAPDGSIPEPCVRTLHEVGDWLKEYGQSVYDATDQCGWTLNDNFDRPRGFTCKGNLFYVHFNVWPGKEWALNGMYSKVRSVRIMNGPQVEFEQIGARVRMHNLPTCAPDPLMSVLEIEVEDSSPNFLTTSGCTRLDDYPYDTAPFGSPSE